MKTEKEIMLKDLQLAIELYTEIHNRDFAKEMGNAAEAESAVQFVKKPLKKYRDYPEDAEIFVTWMLVAQRSVYDIDTPYNLTKSYN